MSHALGYPGADVSFTLRPTPEGYIEQIVQGRSRRGLLRIYLGYAAGTGKTYAMLSAAQALNAEGRDVVAGLVETHGRKATQALLEGLPSLPRKSLDYRGHTLHVFDLDAALERKPEILLVDELAHSNLGEGRHTKRWGDVIELLEAGIEVHTTLNVQHLESVAEVVTQITGAAVGELVPDKVLEQAEEIVLIDLPPDELLVRLEAGKIYGPEQAVRAKTGFFKKTHLLALRELTMRKAAHHVDEDARDHLRQNSLAGPWPAGERLLVCVGPSPYSERLVRATKRLADSMSATWVALHVDTGSLSPGELARVDQHLQLAQRLGAEVITQTSYSVVDQVLETASTKNVTKVVTGRTLDNSPLRSLLKPTLADSILRSARGIDILVLGSSDDDQPESSTHRPAKMFELKPYLMGTLFVGLSTCLGYPVAEVLNPTNQAMLYLAAVVATAYYYGRGPSSYASVLSVLLFNFVFVPPRFTLMISEPAYWLTFFGLLFSGLLVSSLTASANEQSQAARSRATDALTLLALSRDLARGETLENLRDSAHEHLSRTFGESIVLLRRTDGSLETHDLEPRELAVADRAFRSAAATGKETETLPGAGYQWHPLSGPTQTLGVVGLSQPVALGARRREDLLEAIMHQVSAALERRSLTEAANEAELLQASERLHTALLNSISHDLRIPLVSIQGALTSLQDTALLEDKTRREALIHNALSETDRLNRLVGNLLQKTRLETGHLTLRSLPCDVEDLVTTTLSSLEYRLEGRPMELDVPTDLPFVPMDFVLVAQVLTNLLENALAYSPAGAPIGIKAYSDKSHLHLEVLDRGVGFGGHDPETLFHRFERGMAENGAGIGLGLSICKGLVEAHHGNIHGRSRAGGGAIFEFTLPLEEPHV